MPHLSADILSLGFWSPLADAGRRHLRRAQANPPLAAMLGPWSSARPRGLSGDVQRRAYHRTTVDIDVTGMATGLQDMGRR